MERLLAYEGPVVHVDHSHRAPARATGLEMRDCDEEVARERRDCGLRLAAREKKHKEAVEEALEKCEEALKAKEAELVKARFQITQLTESERSRNIIINKYSDEVTALKDKVENQAARIRELVEENEALKAQAAALSKPAPAPKAAPAPKPVPAPRKPVIPWKAQELIRDIAKYKKAYSDDEDMVALVDEVTKKLETGEFTPTEYFTMPGLEQKYYDKVEELKKRIVYLQKYDPGNQGIYGSGGFIQVSGPQLKRAERDLAFVRLGGDLNKLLSEGELLRLNERIETEEKWLKSKGRDLSPDGLLGKLYQRRQQLQDGVDQMDDDTMLNSRNPEAIAEAKSLMDQLAAVDKDMDLRYGGPNMIAQHEQRVYELHRPYLYLLYGGGLPIPENF